MSAAIEISGVTKRFGDVVAVRNMHLTIADGEFFALLGPSGCGKTTTLRMIAGLERPTEGSLKIFGDEVGLRPPNKRPVNTVFQNYALFPHMNVLDNVTFGLRMSGVGKKQAIAPALDALAVMDAGDVLQVGNPKEIYEQPANRFVADLIGQTNLIEATAVGPDKVIFANGVHVWSKSDHPAGTRVAVSLRPEAMRICWRGLAPSEHAETSLDGVVESITYLGNALVFRVVTGWTELEVRCEPSGNDERWTAGDEVTVWWDRQANWVVAA